MAPKTSRSRRTKSEIQQEFSTIAEEMAEDKASVSSREAIATQLQEAAVRNAVSDITIEMIVRKMGDLGSEGDRRIYLSTKNRKKESSR